jgi:hypothetical protein
MTNAAALAYRSAGAASLVSASGQPRSCGHERAGRHRHPYPRRAGRGVRAPLRRAGAAALARVQGTGAPSSAPGSPAPPSAPTAGRTWSSTSSPSKFPVTPSTASTTPIPGSRSSTDSPTRCNRRIRWCTAERYFTPSDRLPALPCVTSWRPYRVRNIAFVARRIVSRQLNALTKRCFELSRLGESNPRPAHYEGHGQTALGSLPAQTAAHAFPNAPGAQCAPGSRSTTRSTARSAFR